MKNKNTPKTKKIELDREVVADLEARDTDAIRGGAAGNLSFQHTSN